MIITDYIAIPWPSWHFKVRLVDSEAKSEALRPFDQIPGFLWFSSFQKPIVLVLVYSRWCCTLAVHVT